MGILELIVVVLFLLWLAGFSLHIAGAFIHLLLVLAIIVFLLRFLQRNV